MKHIKQIKPNKRHGFGWKPKALALLLVFLLAMGLANALLMAINSWFSKNEFVFNRPIEVILKAPIQIREREVATKEIIRIMEAIPAPEDLTSEPEQLIYKYFGIEQYRMAIATSRCEGLNHPADGFNTNTNGSIDVGYMRVNSVHFKTAGCSLLEVATPEGNIACGYKIWDRADGVEGNKQGSFSPWVGFTNGCALTKYE